MRREHILPWVSLLLCGCSQFFDLGRGGDPASGDVAKAAASYMPQMASDFESVASTLEAGGFTNGDNLDIAKLQATLEGMKKERSEKLNAPITAELAKVMPEGDKATADKASAIAAKFRQIAKEVRR